MIIFYERFANKENIEKKLSELALTAEEKRQLHAIFAKLYQRKLLLGLLDLLAEEDKTLFLERFYYHPEIATVAFLNERVEGFEKHMNRLVDELEIEVFEMLEGKV